jgi:hypothetical protein
LLHQLQEIKDRTFLSPSPSSCLCRRENSNRQRRSTGKHFDSLYSGDSGKSRKQGTHFEGPLEYSESRTIKSPKVPVNPAKKYHITKTPPS